MNNKVLRIISAVLALGAIAVAVLAIRLSKAPPPPVVQAPASQVAPRIAVVVAAKPLRAGQPLMATDLAVKAVETPPAAAYRDLADAVGRVPVADVAAGTALAPGLFAADSISYLLKPGERAVAIGVDEVSAVGGFVKPGDAVDVLSFTGANGDSVATAQVVVEDVKLLTVGSVSRLEEAAQGSNGGQKAESADAKAAGRNEDRLMKMRSAVVAVRTADMSRLMLAASVGPLRLALRPPAGSDPNATLSNNKSAAGRPPAAYMSDLTNRKASTGAPTGGGYIVQDGGKETVIRDQKKAF